MKKKQIFKAGPWQDIFAQGVVKNGNHLYLAGQVSLDTEGNVIGVNDIVKQTEKIYENIESILSQFDATMDDIVDETIFVTDMKAVFDNMPAFVETRLKAFGKAPEITQTLVQVAGLVMPELMIEIKCVASL